MKQSETSPDPLLLKDGTKCGPSKVCINQVCENYEILKYDCNPKEKCSGHGICNSKRNCHCDPGWAPPDCKTKGSRLGGSIDSGTRILEYEITGRGLSPAKKTMWILLSLFFFLPVVTGAIILVIKWKRSKDYIEEDYQSQDISMSEKASMSESATAKT
ncbi:UNVERIFIED_CONTAM: hypothetical protein K2H54_035752 [Gekko kuhli]